MLKHDNKETKHTESPFRTDAEPIFLSQNAHNSTIVSYLLVI